jgi:predicted AlkP superfamily phosphohydrolase/phosphomutase
MRPIAFSLLALSLLLALSCGTASEEFDRRLIVIGIDGFDWQLIDPMIESGGAPNLAMLKEEGSWGELMSLVPLEKSPVIWTTISTGKTPAEHGVGDSVTGSRKGFSTGNTVRVNRLWDILGAFDKEVAVVNWWVTWPAEPVNGLMVTDYFQAAQRGRSKEVEDLVYPDDFRKEVDASTLAIADSAKQSFAFLLEGNPDEPKDPNIPPLLRNLAEFYAADMITLYVTKHILETRNDLDFYAFYFRGIDSVCHAFWGSMDPASLKGTVMISEIQVDMFEDTIARYYSHTDSLIGEILSYVDKERDTVILCSDHGFRGPYVDQRGFHGGILMHRPEGMIVLYGRDIESGVRITNATVYDVTPTILALYGLPVARDMSGKPLVSAMSKEFVESHPIEYIDTYELGKRDSQEPISSPIDEFLREELRSLGYIDW